MEGRLKIAATILSGLVVGFRTHHSYAASCDFGNLADDALKLADELIARHEISKPKTKVVIPERSTK